MALGQAKISLIMALLRKVFLLIPLIFILPNFFENKAFAVFLADKLHPCHLGKGSVFHFGVIDHNSANCSGLRKIKGKGCGFHN